MKEERAGRGYKEADQPSPTFISHKHSARQWAMGGNGVARRGVRQHRPAVIGGVQDEEGDETELRVFSTSFRRRLAWSATSGDTTTLFSALHPFVIAMGGPNGNRGGVAEREQRR